MHIILVLNGLRGATKKNLYCRRMRPMHLLRTLVFPILKSGKSRVWLTGVSGCGRVNLACSCRTAPRNTAALAVIFAMMPLLSTLFTVKAVIVWAWFCTILLSRLISKALPPKTKRKEWYPKFISGEYVSAIAMTEPGAGSDLQGMKTTAIKQGNHYVINGSKTFITNGGTANFIIVCAKTDPSEGAKGISLFAVETGLNKDELDGFSRGEKLDKVGLKGQDTCELFFDDMKIPASALIGMEEGKGFYQLMEKTTPRTPHRRPASHGYDREHFGTNHRICARTQGVW